MLTKSLLTYLQQNAPGNLSALAPAYMRLLLGDAVADILNLPASTLAPETLLASPLQGLNGLRNLIGFQTGTYQATRQRLQQEIKRQRADTFRTPEQLGASS